MLGEIARGRRKEAGRRCTHLRGEASRRNFAQRARTAAALRVTRAMRAPLDNSRRRERRRDILYVIARAQRDELTTPRWRSGSGG